MNITYTLPLYKYSVEQLNNLVKESVITRCEMNDEMDNRGLLASDVAAIVRPSRSPMKTEFGSYEETTTELVDA